MGQTNNGADLIVAVESAVLASAGLNFGGLVSRLKTALVVSVNRVALFRDNLAELTGSDSESRSDWVALFDGALLDLTGSD